MTKNLIKWASEYDQFTKFVLSDGCRGETIPVTVNIGYCRSRFDGYLENVGQDAGRGLRHLIPAPTEVTP